MLNQNVCDGRKEENPEVEYFPATALLQHFANNSSVIFNTHFFLHIYSLHFHLTPVLTYVIAAITDIEN